MPYTDHTPEARGYRHTDTSHAAVPGSENAATLRGLVRQALMARPMTADEIAAFIKRDRLSIRPRVTELKNAGRIYDTGRRRMNQSGKTAAVFALV